MTDTSPDLLFDLTLTDEQRMNRETMQRFAAAEMRTLSKAVDAGTSPARDFYPKTAELGLTLLPIPEALGGAGVERSPISNALIFEDLAHGDMALALGVHKPHGLCQHAAGPGLGCAAREVPATVLHRRFQGRHHRPAGTARDLRTDRARHHRHRQRRRLSASRGTKCMVPLGMDAELVLVIAQLDSGEARSLHHRRHTAGHDAHRRGQYGPATARSWRR